MQLFIKLAKVELHFLCKYLKIYLKCITVITVYRTEIYVFKTKGLEKLIQVSENR